MPLSPDPKQFYRKPLYDHSIDFNKKGWREQLGRPKNIPEPDGKWGKSSDQALKDVLDMTSVANIDDVLKKNQADIH